MKKTFLHSTESRLDLNDQNKNSYCGTDDPQNFLFVHAGGEQRNGEKGNEQNIRVSYRFMVPWIGGKFDPFHIQQINRIRYLLSLKSAPPPSQYNNIIKLLQPPRIFILQFPNKSHNEMPPEH